MPAKTKILYYFSIGLILILTIGLIFFKFTNKKSDLSQNTNSSNEIELTANDIKQPDDIKFVSTVVNGEIVSIKNEEVMIKGSEGDVVLKILEGTSIYQIEEGEIKMKGVSNLEIGKIITVEYDTKNNEAISIKINN